MAVAVTVAKSVLVVPPALTVIVVVRGASMHEQIVFTYEAAAFWSFDKLAERLVLAGAGAAIRLALLFAPPVEQVVIVAVEVYAVVVSKTVVVASPTSSVVVVVSTTLSRPTSRGIMVSTMYCHIKKYEGSKGVLLTRSHRFTNL